MCVLCVTLDNVYICGGGGLPDMNTVMQKALKQQHVEERRRLLLHGWVALVLSVWHCISTVSSSYNSPLSLSLSLIFISFVVVFYLFSINCYSTFSSQMFNIHMDLFNSLLDLVVPPVSLVLLAFSWPALTFINFWEWLYGVFFSENMEDKVVIITGASSGIGEQIVYEYAKRKVNLVLVARRLNRLTLISENAKEFGAKNVMICAADVIKEEDCRRFITETINLYGRVDHLVNSASLGHTFYFEEATDSSVFPILMDINFWGNVYPTYAALPYLRESNGRVVVNASVESWLPLPRMSIYSAAKAALINFYETLRFEVKDEVGITVASHGWIGSEMSGGKFMLEDGAEMQWKEEREVHVSGGPVKDFAKLIVKGACRGNSHVRYPSWYDIFFLYRFFAPKILNWTLQLLFTNGSRRHSLVGTGRPLLEEAPSSYSPSSSSTQSPPRRYFASSGSFPPSPVHPMSKLE